MQYDSIERFEKEEPFFFICFEIYITLRIETKYSKLFKFQALFLRFLSGISIN